MHKIVMLLLLFNFPVILDSQKIPTNSTNPTSTISSISTLLSTSSAIPSVNSTIQNSTPSRAFPFVNSTTPNSTPSFTCPSVIISNCTQTNGSGCSNCAFSLNVPSAIHKYIGGSIILLFIIGQTIHYFYLEERNAQEMRKSSEADGHAGSLPESADHRDEEEKDRRERLAYGISTNTYLVAESKTPGGKVTKVLEKRRRPLAPPITPAYMAASINGIYESRAKTAQKEEAMICQVQLVADKWGRGNELISLINDTDVPSSLMTIDEKAKFSMELVQQHVEKMTEQKLFLHGILDDRTRILSGSENLEMEIFSEVRLELKLEMSVPVHLLIMVFSVKLEPQIEQQKTAPPARVSELTSIPNKETPKPEVLPTSNKKGRATISNSIDEKQQSSHPNKVTISSPDKRERRDSSRRKGARNASDLSDLVPLLQQVQASQTTDKQNKERQRTPKESPMPPTPEKPSSGQLPVLTAIKKKKKETGSQGSNSFPT